MNRIFCLSFLTAISAWGNAQLDPVFHPPRKTQNLTASTLSQERVFFTTDLLIWDSREEGLEYAYKNTKTQFDQDLSSFEPESKFEPGFRIGLGGFLPYDRWTLGSLYTYYYTNRSHSVSHQFDTQGDPGPGIIAVWTYPSAFFSNNIAARFEEAHNQWRLHCSFLDLSLSRQCPIGNRFIITPDFGIRAAWIHQRYTVNYNGGNLFRPDIDIDIQVVSSSINMNCSSNNVGPFLGCGAIWQLGNRWHLFGDFSASLLASRFHVGRDETDLFYFLGILADDPLGDLETEFIRLHSEYWTYRSQGQLALGLRFIDTVIHNARPITYFFSAAYEAQVWWRQNGLLRYLDRLNPSSSGAYVAPTQGDLMFHGVNIELGVNF